MYESCIHNNNINIYMQQQNILSGHKLIVIQVENVNFFFIIIKCRWCCFVVENAFGYLHL